MKHTKVTIIPDCPKCGAELVEESHFDKRVDDVYPVGHRMGYWYCHSCGYKSEEVEGRVSAVTEETIEKVESEDGECEDCRI